MRTLDSDARRVLDLMSAAGHPELDELDPVQARVAAGLGFSALRAPPPEIAEIRELVAEGPGGAMALRMYRPRVAAQLPALVFFHGGGFTIGDLELYDAMCRRLALAGDCAVISVDYRLAPEHKFPAAVDDAFAATVWVAEHAAWLGVDPAHIAVGGDSAGGNLAAVVALLAREAGAPALHHQLLLYPVTGWLTESDSYQRCADGYFLTQSLMRYFGDHYLASEDDLGDWRCAPLRASRHEELPAATVLVCGFDPLRDEGVGYAETLQNAGVPVDLIEYPSQIHAFLLMDGQIAQAGEALTEIGQKLRAAWAG